MPAILIVDPDAAFVRSVTRELSDRGVEVVAPRTAEDAVRELVRSGPGRFRGAIVSLAVEDPRRELWRKLAEASVPTGATNDRPLDAAEGDRRAHELGALWFFEKPGNVQRQIQLMLTTVPAAAPAREAVMKTDVNPVPPVHLPPLPTSAPPPAASERTDVSNPLDQTRADSQPASLTQPPTIAGRRDTEAPRTDPVPATLFAPVAPPVLAGVARPRVEPPTDPIPQTALSPVPEITPASKTDPTPVSLSFAPTPKIPRSAMALLAVEDRTSVSPPAFVKPAPIEPTYVDRSALPPAPAGFQVSGPAESTRIFDNPETKPSPSAGFGAGLPALDGFQVAGPSESTRLFDKPEETLPPSNPPPRAQPGPASNVEINLSLTLPPVPSALGGPAQAKAHAGPRPTDAPTSLQPVLGGVGPAGEFSSLATLPPGAMAPASPLAPAIEEKTNFNPVVAAAPVIEAQKVARTKDRAYLLWVTLALSALLAVAAYGILHKPSPEEVEQEKTEETFKAIFNGR